MTSKTYFIKIYNLGNLVLFEIGQAKIVDFVVEF